MPRLIQRLKEESILVQSIERDYLSAFPRENLLKLNATNVDETEIERGIERMGVILAQSVRV
jgi:DNA-binding transcriptional MocR family regulator